MGSSDKGPDYNIAKFFSGTGAAGTTISTGLAVGSGRNKQRLTSDESFIRKQKDMDAKNQLPLMSRADAVFGNRAEKRMKVMSSDTETAHHRK